MELLVRRKAPIGKNTPGEMFLDGVHECFTCEDLVRDLGPDGKGKIKGETAIPAGRYRVGIRWSNRFQKLMMALYDVPFFDGILIHGGNTNKDTAGCFLVGDRVSADGSITPGFSQPAVIRLFVKVNAAFERKEPIYLTVEDVA